MKTHFSEVLAKIKLGEKIPVTHDKKKEVVGFFMPKIHKTVIKRKLGILEGKANVVFSSYFKFSDNDFLGL